MYEHPMKRAGISFTRILYSNLKVLAPGFPQYNQDKMKFTYEKKTQDSTRYLTSKVIDQDMPDLAFPCSKKKE